MRNRGRGRRGGRLLEATSGGAAFTDAGLLALAPDFMITPGPLYTFTDASGTLPAGNGDTVGFQTDRGSAAKHISQAVAGSQPSLILSNGKWLLRNPNTRFLTNAVGLGGAANAVTLTIGAAWKPAAGGSVQFLDLRSVFLVFNNSDAGNYGWYDGSWKEGATPVTAALQTTIWRPNSGTITRNGLSVASGVTYNPGANTLDGIWLFANHSGAANMVADLYGLALWKRALTAPEGVYLEGWLQSLL